MENVQKVEKDGKLLAVVVKKGFESPGLSFLTPNEFPFQLGIHKSKKGTHVEAHKHIPFKELKDLTPQEFFYVKSGKIEVGIYDDSDTLFEKVILEKDDMILLNCGHEVKYLEDSEFVELKQGPYRGKDEEKEYIK